MQMLRHPNVVTLWEVIDDPRSRKVYMIQDFMERGSLLKEQYEVDPIPECIAISKFIQAARGLQYIHSFGIIHGDMKPSNILEDAEGRVSAVLHPANTVESLQEINRASRNEMHHQVVAAMLVQAKFPSPLRLTSLHVVCDR